LAVVVLVESPQTSVVLAAAVQAQWWCILHSV
jgi:hypothetical protein